MNKFKWILCCLFVVIELVFYYFILFNDIIPTNISCYISICLCFLVAILLYNNSKDWIIVVLALFFTLIADLFLVLLFGIYKEIAMISFCFTQVLYAIRLFCMSNDKKLNLVFICLRIALCIIVELVGILVLKQTIDLLVVLTLIYFVNLLLNIVHALILKRKCLVFAIGLILFLMCDLWVGLPIMCEYLNISQATLFYKIVHSSFNFVWLFYLPSQVLIVFSILSHNKQKNIENTN